MGDTEADEEIERAAGALVDKHGPGAAAQAALSAETMLAAGHFYIDQWARWRRIAEAVERQLPRRLDAGSGAAPIDGPDSESVRLSRAITRATGRDPGEAASTE